MDELPETGATNDRPAGVRGRASIYDVAARAGVSHMTVSRTLNGHPNIREATRQRVIDAVEELNYSRSPIARALVTKRAMRIGVLIHGQVNHGPNTTLRAFERAARNHGYTVSAVSIDDEARNPIETEVFELVTQGVDAVCLIATRRSSLSRIKKYTVGVPTLVVKDSPDDDMRCVSYDQKQGTIQALEHLIALGHRHILHLAGPLDWVDADSRAVAWRATLERHGLPVREPVEGDWSSDFGYAYARDIDLGPTTAIFVANDQMALGVLHGLADRGIRVPEELSVVGFDDLPEARHFTPPLTTVRQDFDLLGEAMMADLLDTIEGREPPTRDFLETALVIRASTAPPPASAGSTR